jgi:GAF domain-containing protein
MKIGRLFPELVATLGRAASPEAGFARALRRLVALSGATAGGLAFRPGPGVPLVVTAGARPRSAMDRWLRERLAEPARGVRRGRLRDMPPGWTRRKAPMLFRAALAERNRSLGQLVLLGPGSGRGLGAGAIPASFPRGFALAMEQAWRLHQHTLRLTAINEITALTATTQPIERVYQTVADVAARLIGFDSLGVTLLDRERGELRMVETTAGREGDPPPAVHLAAGGTLADWVAAHGTARRVDDLAESVPELERDPHASRGFRSAIAVPLVSQGEVIGVLHAAHRGPQAFADGDVEVLSEVARPLASAIEHSRLHVETVGRAEALAALNRTSQLIVARLDLPAVLETISRAVTSLIGSTGCAIGLFNAGRTAIDHVAAHGFQTTEWASLSVPVGQGIIGAVAASGAAIRVDDIRSDPRSAQRDVDTKERIRAMLSVPLRVGGEIIGVLSAFSTTRGFFTARHQTVLEGFADQAGIAIQNARLFEESQRRARETQALLRAGRAVSQSLEVGETIRVILHQAREVLGVQSCGLFTLDEASGELSSVASLDIAPERLASIRVRVGQGITGLAVQERRAVQSADLFNDPRVWSPQVVRTTGFRSMVAAPLLVGERAIGALTVLREDVHHFTAEEESLVSAFADQAAMALEHARLFSSVRSYSEQLEGMVAARTRELDEQKRFVEVVLETLPMGLYVLDADLRVVSANRQGAEVLPWPPGTRRPFVELVPAPSAERVRTFLRTVLDTQEVRQGEEEMPAGAESRTFRLTAAPLRGPAGETTHTVLLIEDITLQKRMEQQMLLTERLTTAGRLAAGVAHELNNPLATIAGCAEALKERGRDPELLAVSAFKDFPSYLSLIEEEAFRCKEITGSLLQFVRDPGSRRAPTDVNGLVEKALDLLGHQPRFAPSRMVAELDPGVPEVVANEGQIRQVFLGLAANALEAMEGQGTLTVRTRRQGLREVEVEFADQGPGIPDDILARVFDPFFTTKPPGQGTGLGLAIAQGIVADHGGRIEVSSRPGAGATFRVLLPITPGDSRS